MSHVKIHSERGIGKVEVDGLDMSNLILRKGFRVEFDTGDAFHPSEVHMIVAADTLEVDLPDAVIHAMQAEPVAAGDE